MCDLEHPDESRRLSFEQSMKIINERYGEALKKLAVAHFCPDPDNCSFGGEGCITED